MCEQESRRLCIIVTFRVNNIKILHFLQPVNHKVLRAYTYSWRDNNFEIIYYIKGWWKFSCGKLIIIKKKKKSVCVR